MTTVLVVGAAASWAMVGLIWLVQVVHYPMLAELSPRCAAGSGARHGVMGLR